VISEYEAALAAARAQAQETIAKAGAEAVAASEKRSAEVSEALAAEAAAAAERVAAAQNNALTELRGVATELAQAAAERLIDGSVPATDVEAAVDAAIQQNASGS